MRLVSYKFSLLLQRIRGDIFFACITWEWNDLDGEIDGKFN